MGDKYSKCKEEAREYIDCRDFDGLTQVLVTCRETQERLHRRAQAAESALVQSRHYERGFARGVKVEGERAQLRQKREHESTARKLGLSRAKVREQSEVISKLLGDFEMLGYMLGMGSDDDTSPEAVLRFAERLNRGSEPTDDDATQGPPGWSVCGKPIPGTERTVGGITSAHGCMDEPGHDGPCRFDARADGGEVGDV